MWSTDAGAPIEPHRPEDVHIRANIVQAVLAYARGELGRPVVPLDRVDRIIAIGSDRMMAAVKAARHGVLEKFGVEMIGANAAVIDKAESRDQFKLAMERIGLEVPRGETIGSLREARKVVGEIGGIPADL